MTTDDSYREARTHAVGRYTVVVPRSIKEAQARKRQLEAEIQDITFQLGEPQRKDANGAVMQKEQYRKWARAAKAARLQREAEVKFLKDWIAEAKIDVARRDLGVGDTDRDLLARCHELLSSLLQDEDVASLAPEYARPLCDLIGRHLRSV